MNTTKVLSAIVIIMCIGLIAVDAKKVKTVVNAPVMPVEDAPLIHDYF